MAFPLLTEVCELKFPQKEARLLVKRWRPGHSEQKARPDSSPSSPSSPLEELRLLRTSQKGKSGVNVVDFDLVKPSES